MQIGIGDISNPTHDHIIANTICYLRYGICRARCNEHNVCPPTELYVQYGIPNAVVWLQSLRSETRYVS